ncbi:MAG: hypothetical protein ACR2LV_02570 [Solirubrobacteraceae bacterium]
MTRKRQEQVGGELVRALEGCWASAGAGTLPRACARVGGGSWIAPAVLARGPVICGLCSQPFRAQETGG